MSNAPIKRTSKIDYNLEPVHYCSECLSLRIRFILGIEGSEFCDKCGSTDILTSNIQGWETLYLNKYGYKFINDF